MYAKLIESARSAMVAAEAAVEAVAAYAEEVGDAENARAARHVGKFLTLAHETALREFQQADREKRIPGDIAPQYGDK